MEKSGMVAAQNRAWGMNGMSEEIASGGVMAVVKSGIGENRW